MNKNQKIVLWIVIAIIVLMGLVPPRISRGRIPSGRGYGEVQYEPIFVLGKIDFQRLALQWFLVSIIGGGLIYTFKDTKDKKPKDDQKQ